MRCTTEKMTLGQLWLERNRINAEPPYQRESGVWAKDKKQLFLDSIINRYDIPKFYFHDLTRTETPFQYAVIDGKQRLAAIYDFMNNDFPLATDFDFLGNTKSIPSGNAPKSNQYYKDFDDELKEYFKSTTLDVVRVEAIDEDEIEDLFSRLNNGEPLNASEKRNAMGGEMVRLIREVASLPFFSKKLGFPNRRGSFHEVAAKFIALELTFTKTKIRSPT